MHCKLIKTLYADFQALCFVEKLPWYLNVYLRILYIILKLHQGFVYRNWE